MLGSSDFINSILQMHYFPFQVEYGTLHGWQFPELSIIPLHSHLFEEFKVKFTLQKHDVPFPIV